jgi:hypothetical protein
MLQQYLIGKPLEDVLDSLNNMNVDDFFIKIRKYNIIASIPEKILKEKQEIRTKNISTIKLITEQKFDLLPRDKDGICFINGNFYYSYRNLNSLPDNLKIAGDLSCGDNQLTSLPYNLTVGGDLHCQYNKLKSLPDNLYVGG